MATKKRKKKSVIVPVLKFVGVMAVGGVIGGYAHAYWMKHIDPKLRGRDDEPEPDELEPHDNPSSAPLPYQTFAQMQIPPIQPIQPITQMIIPTFPQFVSPQPAPAPAPAPAPIALSKAKEMRSKRLKAAGDAQAALDRIAAELEAYHDVG